MSVVSTAPSIHRLEGGCTCSGHTAKWSSINGLWPEFARTVAEAIVASLEVRVPAGASVKAGVFAVGPQATAEDVINEAGFHPSGRRSAESVAKTISAGMQPTRRAMQQLLPDFLDPSTHVQLAWEMRHPFQWRPQLFPPVAKGLEAQAGNPRDVVIQRERMMRAMTALARATKTENRAILSRCHPHVKAVLMSGGMTKQICLMREVGYICAAPDALAISDLTFVQQLGARFVPPLLPPYVCDIWS